MGASSRAPSFPVPSIIQLGLGCILAVCFFLKKKIKMNGVCVFYFYFIFLSDLHSLEDGMLGSEALQGRAEGTVS